MKFKEMQYERISVESIAEESKKSKIVLVIDEFQRGSQKR